MYQFRRAKGCAFFDELSFPRTLVVEAQEIRSHATHARLGLRKCMTYFGHVVPPILVVSGSTTHRRIVRSSLPSGAKSLES